MDKNYILKMEAGRELDALVAEKVMGWIPWVERRGDYNYVVWQRYGKREPWYEYQNPEKEIVRYSPLVKYDIMKHIEYGLPKYSKEIANAWDVANKMHSKGCVFEIIQHYDGSFWAYFNKEVPETAGAEREYIGSAEATSASLAICLASLLAVVHHEEYTKEKHS